MQKKIRDVQIYYEEFGAGMPILMLHGWQVDHRLMTGCLEPVFEKNRLPFRRIYPDLPGMGRTQGRPWIDGSDKMLEVLLEFIDAVLPNERFLLAGESYGGYLARGVVCKKSPMIDGLLLICPMADPNRSEELPRPMNPEKDRAFLEKLSAEDRTVLETYSAVRNERVWEHYKADVLPGIHCADLTYLDCLGKNISFSFPVDSPEHRFDKPALILTGRQDPIVGYKGIWNILENYPRATFAVLDRAGHSLQIEQDALLEAHVNEWLRRVRAEMADPPHNIFHLGMMNGPGMI